MLLYVVVKDQSNFFFSAAPEVDKLYFRAVSYLDCALPLEFLQRHLQGLDGLGLDGLEQQIMAKISRGLKQSGYPLAKDKLIWRCAKDPIAPECKILADEHLFKRFCRLLEGRIIAATEYPLYAQELNIAAELVPKLLQKAINEAKGEWLPALKRTSRMGWCCERCGSTDVLEWPALFGPAATCQSCKSLGALSSLQALFVSKSAAGSVDPSQSLEVASVEGAASADFAFSFSQAQQQAATRLLEYSRLGACEVLIWAACGAGKTEICFPLIKKYLQGGCKVLFAAPRQDVVHDVAPRLRRSFPEYRLKVLSGALAPDLEASPLTVATTHQILRFRRAFDLIIFDEMDAYPFANNRALAYGLRQALKDGGRIVYLTATPNAEMFSKVAKKSCMLIRLPARHHGRPLPVPEIIKLRLPAFAFKSGSTKSKNCPEELSKILKELAERGPLLVFVPRIDMVQEWESRLAALFPAKSVAGSWSADRNRAQKVAAFLAGKINVFICTSILERGVTVDNVQVAVLYADHELYDVRALVQMAGRTGRTAQNPEGRALFLAAKASKAMKEAVDWVRAQNNLAWEQGLLD